jgi:hypothetical protein
MPYSKYSKKQKKLAAVAPPRKKITAADLKKVRKKNARDTVRKVKNIKKPFARKIQILTVMEQRAKVAGKKQQAAIAKRGKEALRRKRNGS